MNVKHRRAMDAEDRIASYLERRDEKAELHIEFLPPMRLPTQSQAVR